MANWLDTTFHVFDSAIIFGISNLQCEFMTFICKALGILFDGGVLFLVASVIFMLFKRTRLLGLCIFGAICCGAIITNLTLKPLVARIRPLGQNEFSAIWQAIGSPMENDFSFPSGHATVATDCLLAIFLISKKKKISWLLIVFALFICASRNYLMVHYPTDVIVGILVGSISAVSSYFIVNFLYKKMEKNKEKKFCAFYLDFCLIELIKSKRKNCQVDGVDAKIENEFNQDDKK